MATGVKYALVALFFSAWLVFPGVSLSAEDSWDAAFLDAAVQAADVSSRGEWMQASSGGKPGAKEERFSLTVERSAPSGWSMRTVQKSSDSVVQLDSRLRLKEENLRFKDPELAKKIGMDAYSWKVEGSSAQFRMSLQGKEKSAKTVKITADTTFISILSVQLNALVAGGRLESRTVAFLLGDVRIEARVEFVACKDPLSLGGKDYSFPKGMRDSLVAGDYAVADFSLTGVFKTFYPHHFYFVFRKGASWNYVASWSGKPAEAQFQWLLPK